MSQILFAGTLIALGVVGLFKGDFTPVWAPVPSGLSAHLALVYLCGCVSLAVGLGLLWRRTAPIAARVLLAFVLMWLVLIKLPQVFPAPALVVSWFGVSETAVVVAAAWALYVRLATDWDRKRLGFIADARGLRLAMVLYGLALIHFGLAHLVYPKQTADVVPAWLPSHLAWAYFTGGAYILAGVSILSGVCARLAAVLVALQMAGFTALVWMPAVMAGARDDFTWSETIVSWTLVIAGWVLADTYRKAAWLTFSWRESGSLVGR